MSKTKWINVNGNLINIIRKIGNWDIGFIKYSGNPTIFMMVRGLEYGENPIIYPHNHQVAYDRPERIPDSVKKYLHENAVRIYEMKLKIQSEIHLVV